MKLSIQSGTSAYEIGFEKAYTLYAQAGFEAIDWNMDVAAVQAHMDKGQYDLANCVFARSMEEIEAHFRPEWEAICKSGLTVGQVHSIMPSYAYANANPDSLDYTIPMHQNCIRYCQKMGIPYVVVHGVSTMAIPQEQVDLLNERLFRELIPVLLEGDTVACMENLFMKNAAGESLPAHCSIAEKAVEFIDRMNREAGREVFGLCLDTGHLNLISQDMPGYIRTLGSRIKTLHLHDNDGVNDEHQAPYTGIIPWKAIMEALRDVGYQGTLNFETFRQTTLKTIDPELLPAWLQLISNCGSYFRTILETE